MPVGREGLAVLKSILSCWGWENANYPKNPQMWQCNENVISAVRHMWKSFCQLSYFLHRAWSPPWISLFSDASSERVFLKELVERMVQWEARPHIYCNHISLILQTVFLRLSKVYFSDLVSRICLCGGTCRKNCRVGGSAPYITSQPCPLTTEIKSSTTILGKVWLSCNDRELSGEETNNIGYKAREFSWKARLPLQNFGLKRSRFCNVF